MTTIVAHTLFRLAAVLAVVLAAGAACAGMAHAQQPDDSYHHIMDLSIVSEYSGTPTAFFRGWDIKVENNNVGGPVARHVRVRIVFTDGNGDAGTTIWNIHDLPPGESAEYDFDKPTFPLTSQGPAETAVRLEARIIESDPVEPPGFQFNNATEHWAMLSRRTGEYRYTNADTEVVISISDRFPQAGEATTFTVHAVNYYRPHLQHGTRSVNHHTQYDVQVKISLSKGLAFSGTQPQAPSDTTFNTSTGIWDVGVLEMNIIDAQNILMLPVAVNLTTDSLADLPLEERCLTAEVVRAIPWPSKRENDTATVCLGDDPTVLLTSGAINLIEFFPCVGVTEYPCTSADTLELVAHALWKDIALPGFGRIDDVSADTRGETYIQPKSVFIHVRDPIGRDTRAGRVIWSTDGIMDLKDSQVELTSSTWSAAREDLTVTGPNGGPLPGSFTMNFAGNIPDIEITDTTKAIGTSFGPGYDAAFSLEFSSWGTYFWTMDIRATHSTAGVLTDTGTYTFHVGPISELEVRDGGASPAAPAGQRAFTIVAANNGPDDTEDAQVTLTGLNAADCDADSAQATKGAVAWDSVKSNCVWTIGELISKDVARASRRSDREALTIITSAAVDAEITAAITSTQAYRVCIDSSGEDVELSSPSSTACAAEDATNTWHTTPNYDHISGNDSATIKAKEATGADLPVIESVEAVGPAAIKITWGAREEVNGRRVTHYEVQRQTNPWMTVADNVAGTRYVDTGMEAGANPRYRVRAVNEFDQKGPWSQPSGGRPRAPTDFTAAVASATEITLSWAAPAGVTVTGYHLDVSTDGGDTWSYLPSGQTRTALAATASPYTHTDSTLVPGASRHYRLRAVGTDSGATFTSEWKETSATVPYPKPGVPKNFAASGVSDTKAELSWGAPDAVTGVTPAGYNLQFTKDGGDTWTPLADQGASVTSFTHTHGTLMAGEVPEYRIRSAGTVGSVVVRSDWVRRAAAKDFPAPGAPGSFAATGNSETQATLTWAAPTDLDGTTLSGYELEFSTDGGANWASLAGTSALGSSATSYTHTDTNLAADAVRQYRVRTVGAKDGESFRSGWAYAVASENYPAPGAPRNFIARAINEARVDLSWSAPESVTGVTLTGYDLHFSKDGNTWTSLAAGQSATAYTHTDNTLAAGAIRQYRVRAVGTASGATFESGWVFASAATEEVGPPQNLAAAADGRTRIDLSWGQPGFGADLVTGYRIDYALAGTEAWQTLEHSWRTSPRRYEHTGLSPGERYCYRVAATYAGGTGPFAARACATTEGAPTDLPGEPENLRTTQVGSNYVALEWDKPSVGGAVEYYEYRYNNGEAVRVTPGTATSVRVGNLAPRASYSFQVRAGNSYGTGEWSREILVTLHRAAGTITASPLDLEVEKGGSGSFNIRLKRSPQWPLFVHLFFEGPDCLTEGLAYQQFKILLPGNPPPSKEFWEDINWVPEPGDKYKFVQPWNIGQNYLVDASDCQGGETAVVNYDVTTVPFSYLEDVSTWEFLDLDKEEWREKWWDFDADDDIRPDPLDGSSGPSVKVTVVDGGGGTSTRQSNGGKSTTGSSGSKGAAGSSATGTEPVGMPVSRDPRPTAVSLAVAGTVKEKAGDVSIVATLDAPAPPGGVALAVNVGPDSTAGSGDLTLKSAVINIPAGQTSASGTLTIIDDPVDEDDETVVIGVTAMSGRVPLAATAKVTIQDDDDDAGMTVAAAMPSESSRGRKRLLCRGPAVREPGGRDRRRPQRRRRQGRRLRGAAHLNAGGRQRQPGER